MASARAKPFPLVLTAYLLSSPLLANPEIGSSITGAVIYHEYCSVCHGDAGDGKSRASGSLSPPPRDFTTAEVAAILTVERMTDAVTNGKPGTAMTAWSQQLSPSEIAAVVDYIQHTFMLPITSAQGQGRRIYSEYCSVCHGDRGDGNSRASRSLNPPPRNFTSKRAKEELTRSRMIFSVKYGRPNTAMTAWGSDQLDDNQINAVVDYVRQSIMGLNSDEDTSSASTEHIAGKSSHNQHALSDSEADMNAPFENGMKGDYASGETIYRTNCSTCHGESGNGQGPRAYFINPKPRDFGHPAARASLNRPHL